MSEHTEGFLYCQNKYPKSLSWAENLNKLFTDLGGKFKFSAQDSDLGYLFWQYKVLTQLRKENFTIFGQERLSTYLSTKNNWFLIELFGFSNGIQIFIHKYCSWLIINEALNFLNFHRNVSVLLHS